MRTSRVNTIGPGLFCTVYSQTVQDLVTFLQDYCSRHAGRIIDLVWDDNGFILAYRCSVETNGNDWCLASICYTDQVIEQMVGFHFHTFNDSREIHFKCMAAMCLRRDKIGLLASRTGNRLRTPFLPVNLKMDSLSDCPSRNVSVLNRSGKRNGSVKVGCDADRNHFDGEVDVALVAVNVRQIQADGVGAWLQIFFQVKIDRTLFNTHCGRIRTTSNDTQRTCAGRNVIFQ